MFSLILWKNNTLSVEPSSSVKRENGVTKIKWSHNSRFYLGRVLVKSDDDELLKILEVDEYNTPILHNVHGMNVNSDNTDKDKHMDKDGDQDQDKHNDTEKDEHMDKDGDQDQNKHNDTDKNKHMDKDGDDDEDEDEDKDVDEYQDEDTDKDKGQDHDVDKGKHMDNDGDEDEDEDEDEDVNEDQEEDTDKDKGQDHDEDKGKEKDKDKYMDKDGDENEDGDGDEGEDVDDDDDEDNDKDKNNSQGQFNEGNMRNENEEKNSSCNNDDDETLPWNEGGVNRVELVPGMKVYIFKHELQCIHKQKITNPSKLVKMMTKEIIGKKLLSEMTLSGNGLNRKPFPGDVYSAVKKYVEDVIPENVLSKKNYRKCMNTVCNRIRQ